MKKDIVNTSSQVSDKLDPYLILGLDAKSATPGDIRRAFLSLSLKYHPDKNRDADAAKKFQDILAAYKKLTETTDAEAIKETAETKTIKNEPEFENNPLIQELLKHQQLLREKGVNISLEQLIAFKKTEEEERKNIESCREALLNFYSDYKKVLRIAYDTSALRLTEQEIKERISEAVKVYSKEELQEMRQKNSALMKSSFLWKAEKENCAPIYLFGTIHKMNFHNPEEHFIPALDNIISQVDVVATEVELIREQKITSLSPNQTLDEETYSAKIHQLDIIIAEHATAMGKSLKPLENEIVRSSVGINQKELTKAVNAYNSIDPSLIKSIESNFLTHVSSHIGDALDHVSLRNMFWMQNTILADSIAGKSQLIACGTDHNSGVYGLPTLLASQGYTLKPLMQQTPLKLDARDLIANNSSPSFFHPPQNAIVKHQTANKRSSDESEKSDFQEKPKR